MNVIIPEKVHSFLIEKLKGCGLNVNYCPNASYNDVLNEIDKYEILVVRSKFKIDANFLNRASKLKIIGRYGSGLEGIDIKECEKKGIKVINSPEGNRNAVGEHTLGLLLSLTNKICKSNVEIKNGKWDRDGNWGTELEGKTIGIIGFGNTGSYFAKKLMGFDVEVVAYDKFKSDFGNEFIKEVDLDYIYQYADVVSLHIPLNDENYYWADNKFFSSFSKPFIFINTSRGKLVDTLALVENLKKGKIIAAGLDVLEYEKNNFESLIANGKNKVLSELIDMENVIITPHVAGWSYESFYKLAKFLAEKICHQVSLNKL